MCIIHTLAFSPCVCVIRGDHGVFLGLPDRDDGVVGISFRPDLLGKPLGFRNVPDICWGTQGRHRSHKRTISQHTHLNKLKLRNCCHGCVLQTRTLQTLKGWSALLLRSLLLQIQRDLAALALQAQKPATPVFQYWLLFLSVSPLQWDKLLKI